MLLLIYNLKTEQTIENRYTITETSRQTKNVYQIIPIRSLHIDASLLASSLINNFVTQLVLNHEHLTGHRPKLVSERSELMSKARLFEAAC